MRVTLESQGHYNRKDRKLRAEMSDSELLADFERWAEDHTKPGDAMNLVRRMERKFPLAIVDNLCWTLPQLHPESDHADPDTRLYTLTWLVQTKSEA